MNPLDHSHLDGKLLQLLVAVVEEGSITRAAQRLGVTQSAVSHLIGKLRAIVDDPLVVKSGRGIVPTVRAEALAVQARTLLEEMRRFAISTEFHPERLRATFTIAANDFQCDLLLPPLLSRLRERAPAVSLRVIPSAVPTAEMLRNGQCDLIISPRPPDAGDVLQKRLFRDSYRVFFDPSCRTAPQTLEDYLAAEHVTVVYEPRRALDIDLTFAARGVSRHFVAMVPGFSGVAAFVRGTARLATLPGLLSRTTLSGLSDCAPPIDAPTLPMFMIWHLRYRHDPVHCWLRTELEAVVTPALRIGAGVIQADT